MNGFYESPSDALVAAGEETGLFGVDRPCEAWEWMRQSHQAPEALDWVRPQVVEAWRRCLEDYGLQLDSDLLKRRAVSAQDRNGIEAEPGLDVEVKASLIVLAYNLYSFLRETGVTLLLADASGHLIHVMDSALLHCPAGRHLARLGVSWSECHLGNNGLGTASLLREPVAFDGKEHFYRELHPFATAGYPVIGPDGRLLATLGIMTDHRDSMPSLLAFLRLAGYLIKENLFKRHAAAGTLIRLRPANLDEKMGTHEVLFDGMLSVDEKGQIQGANQTALLLLGHKDHKSLLTQNIGQALGIELDDLTARTAPASPFLEVAPAGGVRLVIEAGAMPQDGQFWPAKSAEELREAPSERPAPNIAGRALPRTRTAGASVAASAAPFKAQRRERIRQLDSGQWKDSAFDSALQQAIGLQEKNIQILITGESGVGKDYLVRRMHAVGPRKNGPLIAINCAAIPRDLIESELFGYEPGSFTGAHNKGKPGKFLLANKGILFLDEIGDMALDLQATLLRVLDSSQFVPIGGSTPITTDVHLVAATNCRLQEKVRQGAFRRDLYYRLNGAHVWLPPLRERPDKMHLIQHLLEKELEALNISEPKELSDAVWQIFLKHQWPGNIRELRNLLRSLIIMSADSEIQVSDLPQDFIDEMEYSVSDDTPLPDASLHGSSAAKTSSVSGDGIALADYEALGIRMALTQSKGNVSEAARILGITRPTLYKKISRYGLRQ